jgi:LPS sulfotransferase NodH
MDQRVSYLICATHRSGSYLLCEVLQSTGLAGNPEEYFYEGFQPKWFQVFGVNSFPDYLQKVVQVTATDNGVFGAKIMADHFWHFVNKAQHLPPYRTQHIPPAELLTELFPGLRYIWLTRRDKIRQAVSYVKAKQLDLWRSSQINNRPKKKLHYSARAIEAAIQYLIWQDTLWQEYFTQSGLGPLTLVYEDFSQKPVETAERVIEYLGITKSANWTMGELNLGEKLSDAVSEEWVKQYAQRQGYWINFLQQTNQSPLDSSHFDQRTNESNSVLLPEETVERPGVSSPSYADQVFIEQQLFLNSLSSEDIARRIPFWKMIKAFRFKITSKLRHNW